MARKGAAGGGGRGRRTPGGGVGRIPGYRQMSWKTMFFTKSPVPWRGATGSLRSVWGRRVPQIGLGPMQGRKNRDRATRSEVSAGRSWRRLGGADRPASPAAASRVRPLWLGSVVGRRQLRGGRSSARRRPTTRGSARPSTGPSSGGSAAGRRPRRLRPPRAFGPWGSGRLSGGGCFEAVSYTHLTLPTKA